VAASELHESMKRQVMAALLCATFAAIACARSAAPARIVALKSTDGTGLEASYFAAPEPGPGVLLYHQSNRARDSWDGLGRRLAAAGIHVLAVDTRGRKCWPGDLDAAFQFLASQPGVQRAALGAGGAGALGVDSAVETARRHPGNVRSLVLLSGETLRPQLEFLHQAAQLPGLFVVSDDDEYPPTQEAMQLLYASASAPAKKLIHYVAEQEAPWLWYEPVDVGRVPARGGHGTDLFATHPELPGIIVHWFATTLIQTPGHAPADPLAAASLLAEVEFGAGVAEVRKRLLEARRRDRDAQLWPEISMSIIGQDFQRAGNAHAAVEVFELNLLAYPDSADANENVAEAYQATGQTRRARQYARTSLALLADSARPGSSWATTEQFRGEIRRGAEKVLKETDSRAQR